MYATIKEIEDAIITLDQEKALDKVNWEIILKILKQRNFGEKIINRRKILYSNITSKVKVNWTCLKRLTLKEESDRAFHYL